MNDVEYQNYLYDKLMSHTCLDPNCHLIQIAIESVESFANIKFNKMEDPAKHDVTSQGDYWDRMDSITHHPEKEETT